MFFSFKRNFFEIFFCNFTLFESFFESFFYQMKSFTDNDFLKNNKSNTCVYLLSSLKCSCVFGVWVLRVEKGLYNTMQCLHIFNVYKIII